jgi:AcrR family transcriptional regulator
MVARPPRLDAAIVEGARRAIEEFGWAGATLERIARAAGVSRMTLHRAQVSKQCILEELSRGFEEEHRAALWPALTADGDARTRLELALGLECELAERSLELLAALDAHAHGFVFHEQDGTGLSRDAYTQPIQRLLRDGASDGSLRLTDPGETATILFNMVGLTYRHLRLAHNWAPERAQRGVVAACLAGVVP